MANPPSPKDRQHLVAANVPFVRAIAAKVKESMPREIEFDDLVAYGMQGLLEAAERYDPRHGTSFTTFAYYRVRGAIFDGLRGMGWLPRNEYAKLKFEERAATYLQNLTDRDAGAGPEDDFESSVRSLADALGGVAAIFVTSLDAEDKSKPESQVVEPQQELEDRERSRVIAAALATLPDKERQLMEAYYYKDQSLAEAGKAIGLSKSWSSRLHARAITLLKDALQQIGEEEERLPEKAKKS